MKKWYLVLICCFFGKVTFAQNPKIDSLKALLNDRKSLQSNILYSVYNNLGYEYSFTNTDSALVYVQKAHDISVSVNKENWKIQPTISLGFLYYQKGFTYKAIEYNYKALRLAEKFKDTTQIEYCYRTLAEIYHDLKDYPKAISNAEKGLILSKKIEFVTRTNSLCNHIG